MVDWQGLLVNALWILGLACALAGLSIKSYMRLLAPTMRAVHGQKHAYISLGRSESILLRVGPILFCGGVLLLSTTAWERAVWALALVLTLKSLARHPSPAASTPEPSYKAVDDE